MDLNAVALGIAANVNTIDGVNALHYAPADGVPPLFWVGDIAETFNTAMGNGQDDLLIDCTMIVAGTFDEESQKAIREYMNGSGAKSIRTVLRTDRTLGGAASDIRAVSATGPVPIELAGNRYYGARFTVQVIGRGNA